MLDIRGDKVWAAPYDIRNCLNPLLKAAATVAEKKLPEMGGPSLMELCRRLAEGVAAAVTSDDMTSEILDEALDFKDIPDSVKQVFFEQFFQQVLIHFMAGVRRAYSKDDLKDSDIIKTGVSASAWLALPPEVRSILENAMREKGDWEVMDAEADDA